MYLLPIAIGKDTVTRGVQIQYTFLFGDRKKKKKKLYLFFPQNWKFSLRYNERIYEEFINNFPHYQLEKFHRSLERL